jgi:hypothetical protein
MRPIHGADSFSVALARIPGAGMFRCNFLFVFLQQVDHWK